jgi:hypothetical protein
VKSHITSKLGLLSSGFNYLIEGPINNNTMTWEICVSIEVWASFNINIVSVYAMKAYRKSGEQNTTATLTRGRTTVSIA